MFFFSDINDQLLHHLSFSPMRYQLARINKEAFYFFIEKDERLENIFLDFKMTEMEKNILYHINKCEHIFYFEIVNNLNIRRHIYDFFKDYRYKSILEEIKVYRYIESIYDENDQEFLINYQKDHPNLLSILVEILNKNERNELPYIREYENNFISKS